MIKHIIQCTDPSLDRLAIEQAINAAPTSLSTVHVYLRQQQGKAIEVSGRDTVQSVVKRYKLSI